jgi:hypothetical protein
LVCWIVASLVAWRSVRFSGFFQTANRALQFAGELEVALPAGLVPDLATYLVERFGCEHHDMERVHAPGRLRGAFGDRPGDPGGHVRRDQFDLFAALLAQRVEELKHRPAVAARRSPDQPAASAAGTDRTSTSATSRSAPERAKHEVTFSASPVEYVGASAYGTCWLAPQ